ncbi:DUF2249 domain-containing protein [Massilia endophytica]|uniref:DUF2249 domain-containing protein n=1 Tax=Massilia endophytica TaxID=2899220 RepID=UPI001E2FB0EB|nr:DUF2249 domain-containing protein [Massilia endophytica]UGQ46406.1 DUF2249 domain-containing protein [Massilia endophytica]
MPHDCSTPQAPGGVYTFDARGVARRFRHAAIFGALESLYAGETMRFYNDHDPLPLMHQLAQHFGARLKAAYVARVPGEVVIDFKLVS